MHGARTLPLVLLLALACGEGPSVRWPGRGPYPGARLPAPAGGAPAAGGLSEPPDEYETQLGQWGLDIDESRSVVRTGERSMWFKASNVSQTRLWHDADHRVPVQAGSRYKAWAVFQADRTTVGNNVVAGIAWFAADKVSRPATSGSSIYNAVATSVNTWQRAELIATAPDGAAYAGISFGRDGVNLNAYFDEVDMVEAVPLWDAYIANNQTIANGGYTTVPFDETTNVVDVEFDTATGIATITIPGFYFVHAMADSSSFTAGDTVAGAIYVNSALVRLGNFESVSGARQSFMAQGLLSLSAGDTVEFRVSHSHAPNITINASTAKFFSGTRIM